MTTEIFLIILFAAFLHAFWNALVKSGDDKLLRWLQFFWPHTLHIIVLFFVNPLSLECWPYLFWGHLSPRVSTISCGILQESGCHRFIRSLVLHRL